MMRLATGRLRRSPVSAEETELRTEREVHINNTLDETIHKSPSPFSDCSAHMDEDRIRDLPTFHHANRRSLYCSHVI